MNQLRNTVASAALLLRQYRKDESGVVSIFAMFMVMMMVLVGGIGVDLMHNEMERTRIQYTLDRAILAAADLDQKLDPQAVVEDYFDKAGMSNYLANVTVDEGLNYRIVTANASTGSPTQFMHLMGVNELSVPAVGTAEERITNVEVSLVVDVSGSMEDNGRMQNLRNAAKQFINTLLREETEDLISINFVPYSEHVNIGKDIYDRLNTYDRHEFSYCVEIPNSEFDNVNLNTAITYDQMQHYQWNWNGYNNHIDDTVCPTEDFETLTPMSQSRAALDWKINRLEPRAGTSIFLGVKWGAAFLDPSTRGIVNGLISDGVVDSVFAGRPASYDDEETLKTIVVMSDGKNQASNRIVQWAYNSDSEYVHWDKNNFNHWLYWNVPWWAQHYYWEEKYNATIGDNLLDDICDAAKDKGIVIWGVGFEVDTHGASQLENCASSVSHYFDVEGVEIQDAFKAIASQINQLRLTQ